MSTAGPHGTGAQSVASVGAAIVSVAVRKQLSEDRVGGQLCGLHCARLQVSQGLLRVKEPYWTPRRFRKIPVGALPLQGLLSYLQGWEFQCLCAFPATLPAASPAVTESGPGGGAVAAGTPSKAAGARRPPGCPWHHCVCRAHR